MNDTTRGMKAKTIRAILSKKFKTFAASIEDEAVRSLVEKNTIITGGCIASMLLGEKINDFDLYFTNKETTKAVAQYYVDRFKIEKRNGIACAIFVEDKDDRIRVVVKSAGVASEEGAEAPYEYFEGRPEGEAEGYISEVMGSGNIQEQYEEIEERVQEVEDDTYRPVFLSTNAITLSNRIQIILRFYGEVEQIHEFFDYAHATNSWTSHDNKLTLRPEALEALLCRELRYVGSKYPLCSIIRMRKFLKRGWVINAGQILKILMNLNSMDLTDPLVLEEQLTGVDSAYFTSIIKSMKERDPDRIDAEYLVTIIDRMF